MKICAFSDIHGNGHAFHEAYNQILSESADVYFFLGDLCGYFFNQIEVFLQLKEIPNLIHLRGNHDQYFLNAIKGERDFLWDYTKKYGRSMEILLNKDYQDMANWLETAPVKHIEERLNCYACHGAPGNVLEGYIYPDTPLGKTISGYSQTLFLTGHTHYPMVRRTSMNQVIVNPGSLGQPRDGALPSYAVIDTNHMHVDFKHVHYDRKALSAEVFENDPDNQYLKKIIWRHHATKTS